MICYRMMVCIVAINRGQGEDIRFRLTIAVFDVDEAEIGMRAFFRNGQKLTDSGSLELSGLATEPTAMGQVFGQDGFEAFTILATNELVPRLPNFQSRHVMRANVEVHRIFALLD